MAASWHTTAAPYFPSLFNKNLLGVPHIQSRAPEREHLALGINPAPLKMCCSYPRGHRRAGVQSFLRFSRFRGKWNRNLPAQVSQKATSKFRRICSFN